MKERPIIFNAPMVRAILVGRKTQTRRVVKLVDTLPDGRGLKAIKKPASLTCLPLVDGKFQYSPYGGAHYEPYPNVSEFCPYGERGDRIWVRETWNVVPVGRPAPLCGTSEIPKSLPDGWSVMYKASGDQCTKDVGWRPSIHMPRWASRITLEITSVSVERLQDISAEDCIAEGISTQLREHDATCDLQSKYKALWQSIYGTGSWDANPWVWVLEFKRVEEVK